MSNPEEKNELVKNLMATNKLLNENMILTTECNNLKYWKRWQEPSWFGGNFLKITIPIFIIFVIGAFYLLDRRIIDGTFIEAILGILIFPAITSYIIFNIYETIIPKLYKFKQKEEEFNREHLLLWEENCLGKINDIQAKIEYNIQLISQYSIVPVNYMHTYCISKFIEYLINLRADNLKEVINLYEFEQQQKNYMNSLNNLQLQQMELINQNRQLCNSVNRTEAINWVNFINNL